MFATIIQIALIAMLGMALTAFYRHQQIIAFIAMNAASVLGENENVRIHNSRMIIDMRMQDGQLKRVVAPAIWNILSQAGLERAIYHTVGERPKSWTAYKGDHGKYIAGMLTVK